MQYKEFLTAALVCSVTVPHLSQQLRELKNSLNTRRNGDLKNASFSNDF